MADGVGSDRHVLESGQLPKPRHAEQSVLGPSAARDPKLGCHLVDDVLDLLWRPAPQARVQRPQHPCRSLDTAELDREPNPPDGDVDGASRLLRRLDGAGAVTLADRIEAVPPQPGWITKDTRGHIDGHRHIETLGDGSGNLE